MDGLVDVIDEMTADNVGNTGWAHLFFLEPWTTDHHNPLLLPRSHARANAERIGGDADDARTTILFNVLQKKLNEITTVDAHSAGRPWHT
eukprot:10701113-Lingulodinium_polyedra.AAC.1